MRKFLLTLTLCGLTLIAKSQNTSVEQATFGIQSGLLGIWAHTESKLSDQIAMRGEIGLDAGIWGGNYYSETGFLLIPVITIEPRWYYNLDKRVNRSKRIDGNSGNFVSLKTSYHPDWFVISNYSNIRIVSDLSIIPTWGIKRNIGAHFAYEAGFGVGYVYYFAKNAGYSKNKADATVNLHLRIGYRF